MHNAHSAGIALTSIRCKSLGLFLIALYCYSNNCTINKIEFGAYFSYREDTVYYWEGVATARVTFVALSCPPMAI
jgi:hypothetical protein